MDEPSLDDPNWGITSSVDCDWHNSDGHIEDKLEVTVFDSEESRLRLSVSGLGFGCGALDPNPASLAYIYRPEWVVSTGYGTSDSDKMHALSNEIGGTVNATDCTTLKDWVNDSYSLDDVLDDQFEDPLAGLTIGELKVLLGE